MSASSELNTFMNGILSIKVQRMGGAFAGIMGASGADSDILTKLKRTALIFAKEYTKDTPNKTELDKLSDEIYGYLQTLQLTYTVSEEQVNKLNEELQALTV